MLTVIPAHITGKQGKFAYIYAVGTDPEYRGRGLAAQLIRETEQYLKECGYQGALLFPAEEGLYAFYERLGYLPEFFVAEQSGSQNLCQPGNHAISVCSREDFLRLRQYWLTGRGEAMTYPQEVLSYVYDEAVYTGAFPVLLSKNSRQDYALCYKIKQSLFIKETTMDAGQFAFFLPELCRFFGVEHYRALLAPEKNLKVHRHGMIKRFGQPAVMPDVIPYMNLVLD